ncbi:hypothetical protein EDB89DRAFT_2233996 [Lactarius sanguifluus]|nr:hypothetical protein EDB89DRAFT_2233996 [Lactarius sanguifluus]
MGSYSDHSPPDSPSLLSDSSSGAASRSPCEGLSISQTHRELRDEVRDPSMSCGSATTDVLTDDILLNIFHFCRIHEDEDTSSDEPWRWKWDWDSLVHVCQRWRQIIFASPHHLYIQLQCKCGTPVRSHLGYWPALPIIIDYTQNYSRELAPDDEDNVVAALEHPDRVSCVKLYMEGSQLGKITTVMQESFPMLRFLELISRGDTPVLPEGFLGGSAPSLQRLCLYSIPFPALPTLLSSATHLVELQLNDTPETGYISPEAMVGSLATLTTLRSLFITSPSESATFHPDQIRTPPVARITLPALINFEFDGICTYLENLVARLACPQIKRLKIWFLDRPAGFRAVELSEFINRSENPWLREFGWLNARFSSHNISLHISHTHRDLMIDISFFGMEWGPSHVVQVFDQFPTPLSNVRHLSFDLDRSAPEIGRNEWLQLLRPFTALQTLYVDRMDPPALDDVSEDSEMVSEPEANVMVLPMLELVYLGRCLGRRDVEFFEKIIADRRLQDDSVTRNSWDFDAELNSYRLSEVDKDSYWQEEEYQ